jgi:hypothetical protein
LGDWKDTTLGRQMKALLQQKYGDSFGLNLQALMDRYAFTKKPGVICEHVFLCIGDMRFAQYPEGYSADKKVRRGKSYLLQAMLILIIIATI